MKKEKPCKKTYGFVDWHGLGPLRSSVVLIVGEDLQMIKEWFLYHFDIVNPDLTHQDINDIIVTIDESGDGNGCCFEIGGNYYIYLTKWDEQVFLHEAYHAVQQKLHDAKIRDENGEVGARLLEYLWIIFVKDAAERERSGARQILLGAKED